jgi:hypothetical protein
MKIRLVLALAGMAIGFTGPALAQQNAAGVDPAIIQQLENTISAKYNEAINKHDAAAIALSYRRALHGGRGFCDGQRTALRSEGHREVLRRHLCVVEADKPQEPQRPKFFSHVRFGYNVGRLMERDWSRAERRSYPNQGLLVRN